VAYTLWKAGEELGCSCVLEISWLHCHILLSFKPMSNALFSKSQNFPTCLFPNLIVSAGSQGTYQPKKFSSREVSRFGLCPLGQNSCNWHEQCDAATSNPNSSPANRDGLNRDRHSRRMRELN